MIGHRASAIASVGVLAVLVLLAACDSEEPARERRVPSPEAGSDEARESNDESADAASDMRLWFVGADPTFDRVMAAMGDAGAAAEAANITGMGVACVRLQAAVEDMRSHLPSPDPVVTSALENAADAFARSAELCIEGTANLNAQQISQAADHMFEGSRHITTATTRIRQIKDG